MTNALLLLQFITISFVSLIGSILYLMYSEKEINQKTFILQSVTGIFCGVIIYILLSQYSKNYALNVGIVGITSFTGQRKIIYKLSDLIHITLDNFIKRFNVNDIKESEEDKKE